MPFPKFSDRTVVTNAIYITILSIVALVGVEAFIIGGPWGSTFFFAHLFCLCFLLAMAYYYLQIVQKDLKKVQE